MTGPRDLLLGRRGALGLGLGAAAAAVLPPAAAHEGHSHAPAAAGAGAAGSGPAVSRLRGGGPLPDVRVTDAARRRRRLASEVIGGRVVAIDFVLTSCASLCGVVSAAMAGAQDLLAARLPGEAGLLSIGLDPFGDTPEALAEYGGRFGAGPGWALVNVPANALGEVLRRLGGPEAGADHAPMVLVFDPQRGEVRRLLGLPSPEAIAGAVTAALAARGARS